MKRSELEAEYRDLQGRKNRRWWLLGAVVVVLAFAQPMLNEAAVGRGDTPGSPMLAIGSIIGVGVLFYCIAKMRGDSKRQREIAQALDLT